jgi:restriction endonuclease S subunit
LQKSELEKRLDPFYYVPELLELEKKVLAKTSRKLRHYIKSISSGATPKTTENEKFYAGKENGIPFLRVQNLSPTGVLEFDDCKYINMFATSKLQLEQVVPDKIKLNYNCILISRSGSLGLVNIVEPEIENSILSSHIFKIELNPDKVITVYLEAYLRSQLGQSEIFRNNNGGVIPEINQDALKSIFIIVPPLSKQKEIADHITSIRQKAQQLKDKTKEALA